MLKILNGIEFKFNLSATSPENVIILYTIVDKNLAKYMAEETKKNNIPCFEVLGNLI